MANLRGLASRKRRRASTIVESDAGVPDTDEDHSGDDAQMLDASPSWSRSLWSGSTNGDTTAAGTSASSPGGPRESSTSTCGSRQPRTKFIIGLDYGTTFSSVSYVKFDPDNPPVSLRGEQIRSVTHWPGAGNRSRNPDVPSESWYLGGQFHWGYGTRKAIMESDDDNLDCRNRIIQYAKLLLPGDQKDTRGPRQELKRTLHKAKKDEIDVTKDYLFEVLSHTKKFLEGREGLDAGCEVELVFCVPAGWPHKAIRTMQEILLDIARAINLGELAPPYVLNEPEAAAAYILEAGSGTERLTAGEVFVVCDAGGGTVDAITYKVDQERPFRVQEVVSPTGSNCGSSYVNQALKEKVINRIKSTPYKSVPGASVEYTIKNWLMTSFEYDIKREFLPGDGIDGNMVLAVPGLRRNEKLGFGSGTIHISRREVASLFTSSLQGISKLISQQIRAVASKGLDVKRILLTGGFSEAPIFRAHIEAEFKDLKQMYAPTNLDPTVAVSHGAVFRAMNKADGPKRIVQSNFGFLQIEERDLRLPAHRMATPTDGDFDGKMYIENVLDWVIKKEFVLSKHQKFRTRNWQVFGVNKELIIYQKIWVSDFDNARDHYQAHTKFNKGAEVFGMLQIDLEPVREEGRLEVKSGPRGDYYEIHYELAMEVDGRNLTVKAFCPPGGQCRAETQLCIAAAFIPGTD